MADFSRYAAGVGPRIIFDVIQFREKIEDILDTLRNSYKYISANPDITDQQKHLADIVTRANFYKEQLQEVPDYQTIRKLNHRNQETLLIWVKKLITLLAGSVNVGKGLVRDQIEDLAISIIDRFPELTLEDIAACFLHLKNGGFGELYDSLDGPKVMKHLIEYEKEIITMRLRIADTSDESSEFSTKYVALPKPAGDGPINEAQMLEKVQTLKVLAKNIDNLKNGT